MPGLREGESVGGREARGPANSLSPLDPSRKLSPAGQNWERPWLAAWSRPVHCIISGDSQQHPNVPVLGSIGKHVMHSPTTLFCVGRLERGLVVGGHILQCSDELSNLLTTLLALIKVLPCHDFWIFFLLRLNTAACSSYYFTELLIFPLWLFVSLIPLCFSMQGFLGRAKFSLPLSSLHGT